MFGGVFYLEKGARVRDVGSTIDTVSALKGGFAYLKGDGTYMQVEDTAVNIINARAYDGGVFYLEEGATAVLVSSNIQRCVAYRGLISFVDSRSHFYYDGSRT